MNHDSILVLDYGSQYAQLITRRVRWRLRLRTCTIQATRTTTSPAPTTTAAEAQPFVTTLVVPDLSGVVTPGEINPWA